jgi:hypothetical protein
MTRDGFRCDFGLGVVGWLLGASPRRGAPIWSPIVHQIERADQQFAKGSFATYGH